MTFFPAPQMSERENRLLAEFPAISSAEIADGSFAAALDTYAAERFPLRVPLRQARAIMEIGLGKQETGGVLLCTDGSLCKRVTVNERAYLKNLTVLQNMCTQYGSKLTVAVAPRRIDARREVLPRLYNADENAAVWSELEKKLPCAITFPTLTADAHWYRTDHHWTTAGAYAAYCRLGRTLGYTPYAEADFYIETVSAQFRGTSDAAACLPFIKADRIHLYRYPSDTALTLQIDGKVAPFAGLYDFDRLQKRDQYGVFLGGNCGVLKITAANALPPLLVIKDSFANSLLPFLARHYTITAIDPRYFDGDLAPFLRSAQRILCLCGMQTLCSAPFLRA